MAPACLLSSCTELWQTGVQKGCGYNRTASFVSLSPICVLDNHQPVERAGHFSAWSFLLL